jgi:hypothetical protein
MVDQVTEEAVPGGQVPYPLALGGTHSFGDELDEVSAGVPDDAQRAVAGARESTRGAHHAHEQVTQVEVGREATDGLKDRVLNLGRGLVHVLSVCLFHGGLLVNSGRA